MELDAKQKVLIAIYTEYQKDRPNMRCAITAENLGLPSDVFQIALEKLHNEGLVNDLIPLKGGSDGYVIYAPFSAKMSSSGIEYVEGKLNIAPRLSGEEKVKIVIVKATEWGWEQMKDIGSKVLAEIMKSQMGI